MTQHWNVPKYLVKLFLVIIVYIYVEKKRNFVGEYNLQTVSWFLSHYCELLLFSSARKLSKDYYLQQSVNISKTYFFLSSELFEKGNLTEEIHLRKLKMFPSKLFTHLLYRSPRPPPNFIKISCCSGVAEPRVVRSPLRGLFAKLIFAVLGERKGSKENNFKSQISITY